MPTIKCTDKQLKVIKDACEEYGRLRLGQFLDFSKEMAFLDMISKRTTKKNSNRDVSPVTSYIILC